MMSNKKNKGDFSMITTKIHKDYGKLFNCEKHLIRCDKCEYEYYTLDDPEEHHLASHTRCDGGTFICVEDDNGNNR